MRELTEQEIVRREKANNIRSLGMDPFEIGRASCRERV